ncbi:unnamed protein product [Cladocopium goreaui]|uniref:Uncharacterized protein n=1 Tax=Cladocopium goreaui TaxID=2562237 RepID=A0A9P1GP09_9DINO|nr:unnamed protein product [Cladocopium goreaui]
MSHRRCDARTWQSGSPRRPSTLKIETLKDLLVLDYSPARRVARATCDKPLQRCVSTPNIGRKQVVEDEEEDPEVISLDGCDLFPKRTTNVTFQETVEVYHFEPVDPELLRKVSQRSLEDLTINQRVAEMARNHEKIVATLADTGSFVYGIASQKCARSSTRMVQPSAQRCDRHQNRSGYFPPLPLPMKPVGPELQLEFEKYSQCGFGALHMGCQIDDPEALLADHDVVFVATGRNWPCDEWRGGHGFEVSLGRCEEALILKFALQPGNELQKTVQEARSGVGRFEVPGQPMYILRPGASEDQGWLWIMGLSPDVLNHIRSSIESGSAQDLPDQPQKSTFASFLDMWKRRSAL